MRPELRAVAGFLVLLLVVPAVAFAIRKGRLVGRVLDPEGRPVEGVSVVVTSEDVPAFKVVQTTDAKGVFKVDFEVINVVYHYQFDKVGFVTLKSEQTWEKDGTARYDFTMYPAEAVAIEGMEPVSTSNLAITTFNQGVASFESRDYVTAEAKFQDALRRDPKLRQAWGALSVAQLEQGKYQQAAASAEKAIELGVRSEVVLRTRWEAYRQLGDEAKAAVALKDLEDSGRLTEEAKRIFNEAVAFVKADNDEAAFAKFQEAAALDPTLSVALLGVATTGLKIGRFEDAEVAAETILESDPGNEQAIRIRYNAALGLGNQEILADALLGLAAVEPETAREGLWHLALAAYNANETGRAMDLLKRYLSIDPHHPHANYYLGLLCLDAGDKGLARRYVQRFLELAPDDPEATAARELMSFLAEP